jgi:pimeloyl-ACP methyl ester carboxylesterase
VFAELAARTGREVVILDQRGTGRSRPLLTCGDAPVDAACAAASARRGAPVTAFGVDANADDVADLVRALGARRAHVWGQSFGSGLAIVLAHRHPGVLASLTLEAVDRPASATAGPRAFVAALRAVDAACARQRACLHRTGGNLYHRAVSAAAALAARPLATAAGPVDGDRFVLAVETLLEVARGSSQAPDLVGAAARGDAVVTGQLVLLAEGQPLPGGTFGTLMNAAMNCSEAATTPGAVRRANAGLPAAFGVLVRRAVEQYATTCTRIGRRQDRDAQARPRAGAPVLVVNGVLDPNTGLQAAELVARDFPRATLLRVAGSGHFPVIRGNSCTLPVLARFVVRPDKHPSAPCASAPPSLSAPPPPLTATRTGPVRVEDAAGAFTARGPVSWWSTGSGLFLSADGAAVSVARTAGTAQAALSDLLAALQLPADSPRTATPGGWIAVQVADPARGLTVAAVRAAPDGVRLLAVTAPPNLAAPANTLVVEPLLSAP